MASSAQRGMGDVTATSAHLDKIEHVLHKNDVPLEVDEVSHSWQRCITTHHLDPNSRAFPHIITETEMKGCREPIQSLVLHAREEIDRLYSIIGQQEYVVLLCNHEGVAIHHRGNESKADEFKYWGIWLGGVWSETVEGTNGIGTTISEERPMIVHRDQHFRTRHTSLSCAGVPIFDPGGKLAAVLDASTMNPATTEQSLSLVLAAARVSARGVEERVFRQCFRHSWNLAASPTDNSLPALLLAVDADQRIVGADRVARLGLRLNDAKLNRGVPLSDIFHYDSSIFRCKRAQDVATRLLRTGTNQWWNVLVSPPLCGMKSWCSPTDTLLHSQPRLGMLNNLPISSEASMSRGGLPSARTSRICEYIDSHLQENIALDVLAEMAGMSVHHFARAFRQSVGMPPHGYVVHRRVERAQQLLGATDLPLSEIALVTGFSDQSHFARHFRRLTGISPSVARRERG